ncbi:MAG: hypothetical protein EA397_03495 [Deltaproteobacteria bacterium]|nr:MAG: hypothetical protein EA397_03495 [Deltaproteobacteria bacterium]
MSVDLSAWPEEARPLARRILAFIEGSLRGRPSEPFEELALALHRFQARRCPVRASLTEGPVDRLVDIPAIPVGLFKDLPVGTLPPDAPGIRFLTSGTTLGGRGEHRMRSDALYLHGAVSWARRCLPTWPTKTVNLLLDPAEHPTSSLSHMVAAFAPKQSWHLGPRGIDAEGFRRALAQGPAFVGATSFALAALLQRDPSPLPPGCTLMITGGFKGHTTDLDQDSLYDQAATHLRPAELVTEYGMTELSSQLWGRPDTAYRPPPWLRAIVIDPVTEEPMPCGEAGQLRFVDLCNLDGSVAIETLDQGILSEDGSVALLGRLPEAPVRGCSLTVEEAWMTREDPTR